MWPPRAACRGQTHKWTMPQRACAIEDLSQLTTEAPCAIVTHEASPRRHIVSVWLYGRSGLAALWGAALHSCGTAPAYCLASDRSPVFTLDRVYAALHTSIPGERTCDITRVYLTAIQLSSDCSRRTGQLDSLSSCSRAETSPELRTRNSWFVGIVSWLGTARKGPAQL
jgi:hypothetical protein